jgi:hypothetical protein
LPKKSFSNKPTTNNNPSPLLPKMSKSQYDQRPNKKSLPVPRKKADNFLGKRQDNPFAFLEPDNRPVVILNPLVVEKPPEIPDLAEYEEACIRLMCPRPNCFGCLAEQTWQKGKRYWFRTFCNSCDHVSPVHYTCFE